MLAEIYNPGDDQTASSGTKYIGIGREAGYIYTTEAAQIVPRLSTHAAKLIDIHAITPIGQISLQHTAEADRIFEVEHACLVDESKTNGRQIAHIQLS